MWNREELAWIEDHRDLIESRDWPKIAEEASIESKRVSFPVILVFYSAYLVKEKFTISIRKGLVGEEELIGQHFLLRI